MASITVQESRNFWIWVMIFERDKLLLAFSTFSNVVEHCDHLQFQCHCSLREWIDLTVCHNNIFLKVT